MEPPVIESLKPIIAIFFTQFAMEKIASNCLNLVRKS